MWCVFSCLIVSFILKFGRFFFVVVICGLFFFITCGIRDILSFMYFFFGFLLMLVVFSCWLFSVGSLWVFWCWVRRRLWRLWVFIFFGFVVGIGEVGLEVGLYLVLVDVIRFLERIEGSRVWGFTFVVFYWLFSSFFLILSFWLLVLGFFFYLGLFVNLISVGSRILFMWWMKILNRIDFGVGRV